MDERLGWGNGTGGVGRGFVVTNERVIRGNGTGVVERGLVANGTVDREGGYATFLPATPVKGGAGRRWVGGGVLLLGVAGVVGVVGVVAWL